MKRRLSSSGIITIITILCIFTPSCSKKSAEEANESDLKKPPLPLADSNKQPANQPVSELERLAERSSPDYKGNDARDAFSEILKLRDISDANAVPVLEKIMASNFYSTRIHGFAAAQALFCIGTPEAHEILEKYLLTSQYFARFGIDYTFHWKMDESKRNDFIKQYHLRNLSKDLSIELDAKTYKNDDRQRIDFTLTLQNISDKSFNIIDWQIYRGRMLYFQSDSGRFANRFEPVVYEQPGPKLQELSPKAICQYHITAWVKRVEELKHRYPHLSNDSLMLVTNDIEYDIIKAGRFKVYAMVETQPLTKTQIEKFGFENVWLGRAVSNPAEVEIEENVMSKAE